MSFTHLHMHTEYSLLDGGNKLDDLIKKVKELGMRSVAITDHGNMYGVIEFYKKCKKENIKPIIGVEFYVAPRTRFDKEVIYDKNPYHLTVLAMNNKGYENLVKLVSISNIEGFYYKPRIDMDLLKKYNEGLICLSGCLNGELSKMIINGDVLSATLRAKEFLEIFGKDRYYLELQNNGIKEQVLVNQNLINISKKLDIKLVATNDCHYLTKDDYDFHEILLCIQTKKTIKDEDRMKMPTNEFYIKSEEEMLEGFKNFEEAVYNTSKIADMCNVDIEFGNTKLPEFKLSDNISHFDYVKNLCLKNIFNKYNNLDDSLKNKINERLNYELDVINKMGYIDYFLIVADFVSFAKKNNIAVGPGRGSGAGSLAAYLMDITDVDPLKYNLIFERFLNPERVTMPDFDIDFCYERRNEVISYVTKKYGNNNVASIITFGTMQAKLAIRDIARVLDVSYNKANTLAKLVPNGLGITIDKALELSNELNELYLTDFETKKIIDYAKKVEGMPRHISTHAAGVIITKNEVSDYVPVCLNQDKLSTEYTMTILEELGLLKMDFLGLRTLTVIKDAINMIEKDLGKKIVFDREYNDKKTFDLLSLGKTNGIFQLESEGVKKLMKELKPDSLEDITVIISLYRPGPMDQIPRYIKNKRSKGGLEYTHKSLENILKVTYGCMVYQEQVMQIFRDLAGYTYAKADLVRRAMSKKKAKVLEKEREIFVKGAKKNNIDGISSNKIFDEMYEFAKYAFNKSHATCYAVIAYETAYLKAHYKEYFMAAMMNSILGNLNKIPEYIAECKDMGITVLKPDINESYGKFKVEQNNIIFALETIKNISEKAIDEIVEVRKDGKFKNFIDFVKRISKEHVNKKCIESLIKAGVFDDIEKEYTRYDLLENYEFLIDSISNDRRNNYANQINMFGNITEEVPTKIKKSLKKVTKKDYLNMEKEITGTYISGHPLEEYLDYIKNNSNISSKEIYNIKEENNFKKYNDKQVDFCGIVNKTKVIYTKNNKAMMFASVSDLYGSIDCVIFSSGFSKFHDLFKEDNILHIKGKLSFKDEDKVNLIVSNAIKIVKKEKIYIKLPKDKLHLDKVVIDLVLNISKDFKGNNPVYLFYEGTNKMKLLNNNYWLNDSDKVINELKSRLGKENIKKY